MRAIVEGCEGRLPQKQLIVLLSAQPGVEELFCVKTTDRSAYRWIIYMCGCDSAGLFLRFSLLKPWRVSSGLLLEEECQKFTGGGFLPAALQH